MPVFLSRVFVVAAVVSMVSAVEIKLDWVIRTYNPMTATVGDEAVFAWPGDHNVYVHPSGDCTEVRYFKYSTHILLPSPRNHFQCFELLLCKTISI